MYESLLELHPVVQIEGKPWTFGFAGDEVGGAVKGSERKLSGSYYTPDSLVQELLRSALDPVIERTIRDNPADPRGALLHLRVLDHGAQYRFAPAWDHELVLQKAARPVQPRP